MGRPSGSGPYPLLEVAVVPGPKSLRAPHKFSLLPDSGCFTATGTGRRCAMKSAIHCAIAMHLKHRLAGQQSWSAQECCNRHNWAQHPTGGPAGRRSRGRGRIAHREGSLATVSRGGATSPIVWAPGLGESRSANGSSLSATPGMSYRPEPEY